MNLFMYIKKKLFQKKLRLFIPEKIYASVGRECNIYFNNLITSINPEKYFFEVKCKIGRTDSDRFRVVPTAENIGEYPLTIKIYDDYKLLCETKTILTVAPNITENKDFCMLLIGDSQTAAEGYPERLHTLLSAEKNISFRMVGTNAANYSIPSENGAAHEGYGGWGWRTFFQNYGIDENDSNDGLHPRRPSERNSRFLFPDGSGCKFDFAQYCRKYNNGKIPDYIIIMLGTNDVFCCHSDREVDIEWKNNIYPYMKKMVEEFRKCNSDIKIAFNTLAAGADSQDAFGKCYGTAFNMRRWRLNLYNYHLKLKRAAKEFDIDLIPVHTAIDCANCFPLEEECLNMNSDKKVLRISNGVHPARSGYNQIADCVFAYLKSKISSN